MKVLDYGLIAVAEELQHVANNVIISDESIKSRTDSQIEDICSVLDKHVKKALEGLDKTEARGKAVAKNVTNLRHQIIKGFMSRHMVNKRRYCPVCEAPSREVRSEHNSRIFLKGLSVREANKWLQMQVVKTHLAKHLDTAGNGIVDNDAG